MLDLTQEDFHVDGYGHRRRVLEFKPKTSLSFTKINYRIVLMYLCKYSQYRN